jgi:hypothetical protein
VLGLNTCLRSSDEEFLQPGVSERLDHFLYRKLCIYSCQQKTLEPTNCGFIKVGLVAREGT